MNVPKYWNYLFNWFFFWRVCFAGWVFLFLYFNCFLWYRFVIRCNFNEVDIIGYFYLLKNPFAIGGWYSWLWCVNCLQECLLRACSPLCWPSDWLQTYVHHLCWLMASVPISQDAEVYSFGWFCYCNIEYRIDVFWMRCSFSPL